MTVEKRKEGGTLFVTVKGVLDIATSPKLQEALEGELDDVKEVIFDLKETDYTSSSGLRVFLGTYQILEKKDGRMVLKNVSEPFFDILKMTGFTDFIEIENE